LHRQHRQITEQGASHRRQRRPWAGLAGLAVLLALPAFPSAARAQEQSTYTVGVLGGIGGSFDATPGDGYSNSSYQLNLAIQTEPATQVGLRIGRINLDKQTLFGSLHDAGLTYATIGGEYRFRESYYESGLFLGLGAYRLSGTRADGRSGDQTSVGLTGGVTGEIPLTGRLGILLELSGHYVNLREAKLYGIAHGGLTFHF
jgi:hypothetical protein